MTAAREVLARSRIGPGLRAGASAVDGSPRRLAARGGRRDSAPSERDRLPDLDGERDLALHAEARGELDRGRRPVGDVWQDELRVGDCVSAFSQVPPGVSVRTSVAFVASEPSAPCQVRCNEPSRRRSAFQVSDESTTGNVSVSALAPFITSSTSGASVSSGSAVHPASTLGGPHSRLVSGSPEQKDG